jgi:two-component system sensor histidine kinase QseC
MSPVDELHRQLAEIHEHRLKNRIKLSTPVSELTIVEQQLNELLIRLEASYQREKRFSSNVAHELRTPICELRNLAEVALSIPSNNEDDQAAYEDVYQASIQMQGIVDNLLALARLERPVSSAKKCKVNLFNKIENIKSKLDATSISKGISIDNHLPVNTCCATGEVEIELILINLIDNALNYSPEKSRVSIDIDTNKDSFTLCISNTALDLEQKDLLLMFDRLWRKDKSRTGTNNSGIGLSLVKAYAEFLGLKVELRLDQEQSFMVKLSGLVAQS